MTALHGHMKKNIPQPFPFIIQVALPFPICLPTPKLYNTKYKPKSSISLKDQTRGVLKSEDK